jgi:hypothetical protein
VLFRGRPDGFRRAARTNPQGGIRLGGTGKAERSRTHGAVRRLRRQAQRAQSRSAAKGAMIKEATQSRRFVWPYRSNPRAQHQLPLKLGSAPNHAVAQTGTRALLRQEAVDAGRRPGRDATAEEVSVLSPDRTAESKGLRESASPTDRVRQVASALRFRNRHRHPGRRELLVPRWT